MHAVPTTAANYFDNYYSSKLTDCANWVYFVGLHSVFMCISFSIANRFMA